MSNLKNISKFISLFLIVLSLILLLFFIIRANLYDLNLMYYKKYLGFVVLFFSISVLSFFFNEKIKINLFVFFLSVLSSLYLVESLLNFNEWKNRVGDKRNINKFYKSKISKYKNITTLIPPSAFLKTHKKKYFPLSLAPNFHSVVCNENGEYIINKNDRYGFNSKDKTWDKRDIDYLLIGDSFTYGECVTKENNIDGHIRKISMNQKEILNLGMPANGPLISYATLREYYPQKKNVKNILWFFYFNDLQNIASEKKNPILLKYLNDDNFQQNLITKPDYHLNDYIKKNYQRNHISKFSFLRMQKVRDLYKSFSLDPYNLKKNFVEDNLLILNNIFKDLDEKYKDSNFYLVYLPNYPYYFANDKLRFDLKEKEKKLFKLFNNLGITIIDIRNEFESFEDKNLLFSKHKKKKHYSSLGYEKVARYILEFTKEDN